MTTLRSILFLLVSIPITAVFGILVPLGRVVGVRGPFWFARAYTRVMLKWVEWSLAISYDIEGWENVPHGPVVLMAKHQSAWETLFMEAKFPAQCWIVKKELLWLPFVGWGLMAIKCIAIDRSSGHSARDQIVEQGAARLKDGLWVTIFPEGTRVAPGKVGRYGIGGALLATRTGTPILPMAHNAGEYWGRYAFKKHAGRVRVIIGPPIQTEGRDVLTVNNEVQAWIEARMREISPERYAAA
ncbi:MAG TPA: lysophospholipid acyltransferase family protein [Usitatibacter sp.]|nr:lysophospholipid acyltransferase family protein [Usitatibacter sp.]